MVSDHYGNFLGSFRNLINTTLEPLSRITTLPSQAQTWYLESIKDQAQIEKELLKLRTENLILKSELQLKDSLEMEVARLQRLLGTTGRMDKQTLLIANILRYSSNPISQHLIINKGRLDGVKTSQPVIDSDGVLGQIINVNPTTSTVLLLTDQKHQIPVRIQRTGQRGILTGNGYNQVNLDYIPSNASVEPGDKLISSGIGGVFPSGYPVATVTEVQPLDGSSYLQITAEPVAKIHSSYEVLILSDASKSNE